MSTEVETSIAPPADQAARTRFLTELGRNAVVRAGAGTGKTTLVVDRILALVTGSADRPAVPIERIGAMSFTEASAAELAARVGDGLAKARLEALDAGDEARARALGEALHNLGSASISTIHGFGQRILRDHAIEAGLDPSFEVLGAVARQRLVEEVFELWFDEVSELLPVRRALSFGIGLGTIETLARDLVDLGSRAAEAASPELLQIEGSGGLIQETLGAASNLLERFGAALEDLAGVGLPETMASDQLLGLLRALAELLGDHTQLLYGEGSVEQWENFEFEMMKPRWREGVPYGGRLSPAKWATAFGGESADFKELFKDMRERCKELHATIGARIACELASVLGSFREHFEAEKRRRGVVDFDDLLVLAERLVRTNPEVRLAVMKRYDTLFVDEFQDTDPVQARLCFLLAGDEGSIHETDWTCVVPLPGRLVLVGDPKQSIYRFRKADVETYLTCCRLVADADPDARYTITTNFRTDGALVDYVNRSFEDGPAVMRAPDDGDYQADYIGLVAQHAGRGTGVPVTALVQAEQDALASATKNLTAEAAAVARWLAERFGGQTSGGMGFGDVAVLGRTRATLEVYAEALAAGGIDYVFEGGGPLLKSREALEALTFLAAVVEPGRQTAVVGALRSVWLGLSDEQLAQHRLAGGGWDPNTAAGLPGEPAVRSALMHLAELRARADVLGPRAFVEEQLGATGMGALLRLRPAGPQALMDLVRLRSLLLELLDEGGLGLAAVVRFAGRLARSGSDESGARIAAKGAVRLMTVHASKGLEFGLVVLAQPSRKKMNLGGDTKPWIEDGELIVSLGKSFRHPRFDELIKKEKARAAAELLRLYYVALTRAKHELLVPVFAACGTGDAKPVHERIKAGAFGAYLGAEFATGEDEVEAPGVAQVVAPAPVERRQDSEHEQALGDSLREQLLRVRELSPEPARRADLTRRSGGRPLAFGPSTVADAAPIDGPDGERESGAEKPEAESASETRAGEDARRIGTFVHRAIELRLAPDDAGVRARESGFTDSEVCFVEACVATEAGLESHARAFAPSSRVLDEAPVLWGNVPGEQSLLMNGFIDRLILFEDGSVEIVDFKTDRFDMSDAAALAEHTEHHMVQLGLYALALEAAGFEVRQLTLAYVAAGCDDSRAFDEPRRASALDALGRFANAQLGLPQSEVGFAQLPQDP